MINISMLPAGYIFLNLFKMIFYAFEPLEAPKI